jgi:hypothetical protein
MLSLSCIKKWAAGAQFKVSNTGFYRSWSGSSFDEN